MESMKSRAITANCAVWAQNTRRKVPNRAFPASPSTHLPWAGRRLPVVLSKKASTLLLPISIPHLHYQEANPHLAEKLGAVARLGVKRGNGNKREREGEGEERSHSVFHFHPLQLPALPSHLYISPPNQDGPVSPAVCQQDMSSAAGYRGLIKRGWQRRIRSNQRGRSLLESRMCFTGESNDCPRSLVLGPWTHSWLLSLILQFISLHRWTSSQRTLSVTAVLLNTTWIWFPRHRKHNEPSHVNISFGFALHW